MSWHHFLKVYMMNVGFGGVLTSQAFVNFYHKMQYLKRHIGTAVLSTIIQYL